jgi:hypothetical protein
VSEAIRKRNVAIEPDRIQTRCRDEGARAQGSRQSNRSRLRDWSARRATLIGTSDEGIPSASTGVVIILSVVDERIAHTRFYLDAVP